MFASTQTRKMRSNEWFEQFLKSNKLFWHHQFNVSPGVGSRSVLIEASLTDQYLLHGTVKVGLIFAKLHGLTPLICPSIAQPRNNIRLMKSMCTIVLCSKVIYLGQVLFRSAWVLKRIKRLRSGSDVLAIQIDGVEIGKYIYDSIWKVQRLIA